VEKELRKPLFYGWWIAVAAAIGVGLGPPPIFVFSFPVFLKALTREFHTTRAVIALAFSLHNVVSAFSGPLVGKLVDRVGVRRVVLPCTLLFAVLMVGNRFITISVAGIYLLNVLGGLIGVGCGPIPYSAAISTWFDRRRGAALAVMMIGLGTSAMLMPSIMQRLIAAFSWRAAYSLYGTAALVVTLPLITLLIKNSPAQLGLMADGVLVAATDGQPEERPGFTWKAARHTSTFWLLVAAVVLLGASVHACVIHLAAMLSDQGISASSAALASSLAGAGLLAGRVGTGFLLDRYFGPRIAIVFSAGAASGVLLLLVAHAGIWAFVGAFLVGLGMGAEADIIAYLTSRYFGLKSFAEIYGFTFGAFVLAGAFGAFIMGLGFDRTGSYSVPMVGFLAAIIGAIVLFSRLGPYRYLPAHPEQTPLEPTRASAAAR
jgi:MFS family permease